MAARILAALLRVETGYTILLFSVFVLPEWTNSARVPALVLATVLAAGHALLERRRPIVPLAIVAYVAIYAIAALHGDRNTFSLVDAGQLLALPVFALAVAWAAQNAEVRRRIVWLSIAAVALQLPVVLYEVVDVLIELGWDNSVLGADSVTGLLGDSQASTLGQSGLFAGLLLLAAGCVGALRFRWTLAGTAALFALCALSSTRAAYIFAPLALGAMALALWSGSESVGRLRPRAILILAVAIAPVLFLATELIYPGANKALVSFSGFAATLEEGDQQLDDGTGSEPVDPELVPGAYSTRLPGRSQQISNAVELSFDGGVLVALVGRGIGITALENPTDPITRDEQEAGSVWLARILVETGYLGVLAFAILMAFMGLLWWRNRPRVAQADWDAAIVCALPGITALTLIGAAYNQVLIVRPYATLFWAFLGVAIALGAPSAIARSGPGREPRAPA